MSVTPEAFERARADMEQICAHAASVVSRNNDDWNGRDHVMIRDLENVIDDVMGACRAMRNTLHESIEGVLPIHKSIPF